jgi:hypothetical protein
MECMIFCKNDISESPWLAILEKQVTLFDSVSVMCRCLFFLEFMLSAHAVIDALTCKIKTTV